MDDRADQANALWLARFMAACALLILALGSVLVGGLWIARQTDSYLAQQAQTDAADYAITFFWPGTILTACIVGGGALALARAGRRAILALMCIGLALIVGPYALYSYIFDNIGIDNLVPLRGWAAAILVGALLVTNMGAIIGAWRYVLRRKS
jgi:cytochrome bd-type quinol oxidase subunit 2